MQYPFSVVVPIRLWITFPIEFMLASAAPGRLFTSGVRVVRTEGTVPSGPYSMIILGLVLTSLESASP